MNAQQELNYESLKGFKNLVTPHFIHRSQIARPAATVFAINKL